MRLDKKVERVAAFVHRLLQRAVYYNDAMVCAVLLLVGETAQSHTKIRDMLRSSHTALNANAPPSERGETDYDPKARDPQFARATRECLWVLNLLSRHSHPSVVRLSVLLLFGKEIVFDSHPLDDMTPTNFLQMFVDAKANTKKTHDKKATGMAVFRRTTNPSIMPSASDPYFINANAQEVDVSALFLHRYAIQRQRFLDSLSQVKPSWGDLAEDEDAAIRVTDVDTALFGPSGALDLTGGDKEAKETKKAKPPRRRTRRRTTSLFQRTLPTTTCSPRVTMA
ncbi:hypothetical protein AGDE_13148 [Angomonas deanei]|uniref:CBF/Mak21 family, putative n=1 Tax=Angomonas deanei TaxID=59799 RepID=A0A7G2C9N2_9TRYP|nr:hypothetical protein AGDE_13148 [Angomonas deanei]CAD2215463.1 CBF/Mak21 family, putative [Angomonas deanei]|eukprot:EPY22640.1 hypothetical protein AGDE_13148 [Angomonas deanei]